ncbi:MAG: hypothetical protein WC506_04735 [Candidatus Micrarchaeia archaeon]
MDKRAFLFAFVVFGIMSAGVFAGFIGNATVQVLDSKLRPIEGAQVSVIYRLNDDNPNFVTAPKLTDEKGMANITFTNIEYNVKDDYYKFKMSATYQGKTAQVDGDLKAQKPVYTITLPVHLLDITLLDEYNSPAQGRVTIGNKTVITDSSGAAHFSLVEGGYSVKAEYLGGVRTIYLNLSDDVSRIIVFRIFTPVVNVADDRGQPLSAKVTLGNYTAQTDSSGNARFPLTTVQQTNATIEFGNLKVVRELTFDESDTAKVSLDLNAPKISDVNATYAKGFVTISAAIADMGEFASGFGNNSEFVVNYTIGQNKRRTYMYPLTVNRFQAEIPIIDPKQTVYYTLSASDISGNSMSVSGEFTPEAPAPNATGNSTGIIPSAPSGTDFGQIGLYIVAVLVVLGIVAYIFKKRKEEEE